MSETSDGPPESDEPETPPDGERSSEDPPGGDGPQEADDESDSPDGGDGPPDSDRTASGDGPQEAADEDDGDDRPEAEQRPDDVSSDDGPQEADDELDDAEDRPEADDARDDADEDVPAEDDRADAEADDADRAEVDERAETDADDQADTAADDAGRAEEDDRADTEADDALDRAEGEDTARDEGEADDAAREDAEADDAQDDADRRANQDDADDRADQDAAEGDRDNPPPPDDAEDPGNPPDDEGLERELRPRGRMWEGSWNSTTESQPRGEQPSVQQDTVVVAEPGDEGTEPAEQQRADVERAEGQRTGTEGTEPDAATENGRDDEAAERAGSADGNERRNDPPETPNPYTGDFDLKTGELRFDRDAGNEPGEPQREHDDRDVAEGPWNTDLDEYQDYAKNEDGDWEPARPETDLEREKRNEEMAEKFKGEETVGETLAKDGQDLVEAGMKHVDAAEARAEQKHEQAHPHEESKTGQEQPRYEPADSQLPSTPEMVGSVAMTAVALGALFKQWLTDRRGGSADPDD